VSGNPTRDGLEGRSRTEGCRAFGLDPEKKTLLVFGGSQGAQGINQAVLAGLESLLADPAVQILWAPGPRWYDGIRLHAEARSERIHVRPYLDDMGAAYAAADVVLCRSGAGTVAEIGRVGRCAVFVPLPSAAGGHQEANARAMVEAGAAVLVLEKEIPAGALQKSVTALLSDMDRVRSIARIAKTVGKPYAARTIADSILETAGNADAPEVSHAA